MLDEEAEIPILGRIGFKFLKRSAPEIFSTGCNSICDFLISHEVYENMVRKLLFARESQTTLEIIKSTGVGSIANGKAGEDGMRGFFLRSVAHLI